MRVHIAAALTTYINLLYQGKYSKDTFEYYRKELASCSAEEVNIAIDNLVIRHKDIGLIEITVGKFIKACGEGLNSQQLIEYPADSIFNVLEAENRKTRVMLSSLRKIFKSVLPKLDKNDPTAKSMLKMELDNLTRLKSHYLKLQYGIFSKLEQYSIDSRCIKLMWHLHDKVWEIYNNVINMLNDDDNWDYTEFNVLFGHLHFLIASLIYREEKILYPVAAKRIPKAVQQFLLSETKTYGILE